MRLPGVEIKILQTIRGGVNIINHPAPPEF
jgi:hypothetical protein